jgi:hypothetical protein
MNNNWPYSAEITKKINFKLLKTVYVQNNLPTDTWEEMLSEDIFIFRSVFNLGLSHSAISLEEIRENHGEEEISVIIQESDTSGFSVKKASKQKMRLKNYIDLMKGTIRDDKLIRFAVNVDIGNWSSEIDELRKILPSQVLWCSKDDSLKYLRQHILGMTLPQLYLKINGCWTGGHEENLRFSAANINHGPSPCEWWALDSTQSLQLRECIRNEKNFDIYNSETLWWPDEIFCLIQGFNVYHVIQQPGDLVLVGPGTIHWVKSCGVTTNTAWNFGPKRFKNFAASFERDFINQAIRFKSLVPMNLLSLDLLNNEMATLDLNLAEFLREAIILKDTNEKTLLKESGLLKLEKNNTDNVIHCEICYLETFRIYYKCSKCVENRYAGGNKLCFFCFNCMKNHLKTCKGPIIPVQKFTKSDLSKLTTNLDHRIEGKDFECNFEALKYPFDKNTEEGIYVSPFDGISTCPGIIPDPLKITEILDQPKENQIVSVVQLPKVQVPEAPRVKRKYVKKQKEDIKLSSLSAKKKMSEFDDASDLNEFLQGCFDSGKKQETLKVNENSVECVKVVENKNRNLSNARKSQKNEKNGNSKINRKEKTENCQKNGKKGKDFKTSDEIFNAEILINSENPENLEKKDEKMSKTQIAGENSAKSKQGKVKKLENSKIETSNQVKAQKEEEKRPSQRRRVKKISEGKFLQYLKIEEEIANRFPKKDSHDFDGPSKRYRSTDGYGPVSDLIPSKKPKVSLA